ncbi:hypothetical protein OG818_15425 [Streptomyces virginiae]|uniref:hypothetical protein n=1 Tax=Streptomyces TaxID=1883 RepID=UPI0020793DBC|nr:MULTISPECIES: hypothetical protein [Streptomyces]MCM9083083.1 hypothetical protein [Streptomyces spororaveus]MCX4717190.1 hypothetical protein [Streptomyces virginiae]
MSEDPVFARSAWGTNRYVYNHRNPVGLALIVIAPIVAICAMIGLRNSSRWSEGELRTAVHQGAEDLNGSTQYVSPDMHLGTLIRDAVEDSGTGPGLGLDVSRAFVEDDGHGYTISTEDTNTKYCIRVTMARVDPNSRFPFIRQDHHLTAKATEGSC